MQKHLHVSTSLMFVRQLSKQIFDNCIVKPGFLLGKMSLWLLLLLCTGFAAFAQQDCGRPTSADGSSWGVKLISGSQAVSDPGFAIDGNMQTAATISNGPLSILAAASTLNINFGTPLQIRSGIPDTVVVKFEMPAAWKLDILGTINVTMYKNGSQQVGSYDIRGMSLLNVSGWQDGGQPFAIFKQAVPGDVDRVSITLSSGLASADISQLVAPLAGSNKNTSLKVYEVYGSLGVPRMDSILRQSKIVISNGETATFSVKDDKRNLGYSFKWFNGYRDETPIYTGNDFKPEIRPSVTEQRYTYYVTIEKDGCLLQSKIPVYLIVNPQAQLQGSIAPSRTKVNKGTAGETGRLDYLIQLVNKGAAQLQSSARLFVNDFPMPASRYQIQRITLPQGKAGKYDTTTGLLTGITLNPGDTASLQVLGVVDTSYTGILRNSASGSDELGLSIPITESPFVYVNVKDTSGNNNGNTCPTTERTCNRPDNITYETAMDVEWGKSLQQDIVNLPKSVINSILALGDGAKKVLESILRLDPLGAINNLVNGILSIFTGSQGPPAPPNLQYAGDGNEGTAVVFNPDILQLGQWQGVTAHFDSNPIIAGDSVVVFYSEAATARVQIGAIRVWMYNDGKQVSGPMELKEGLAFMNIIPWVSGGLAYRRVSFPVPETVDAVQVSVAGIGIDLGTAGTSVYEIARKPKMPDIKNFIDKDSLSVQVEQGEQVRLKVKDDKRGQCMLYKWYTEEDLGKTPFAMGPEAIVNMPAGFTGTKYYYLQALANACSDNPSAPLEVKVTVLPSPMLEGVVTTQDKNPKVEKGTRLRYTLTIDNNGLQTLSDTARLKIKALSENDKNFKIDSITVLGRGRFDMTTGEFTGDSIPPKGKVTLLISGVIPPTYAGQPINIKVSGWRMNGKQIPIRQAPPVTPNYRLKVKKVPDQLRVGNLQKLDYTITITNTGTESFPAGSKLYIKDVPREKGYRIDTMYVPDSSPSGGYYVMGSQTLFGAEIPAGGTAKIRVEGFLTDEYTGGPINNDVIATYENKVPLEVEPTPTVNAGDEKYTLYGDKYVISRTGDVKAGDQLDFVIVLRNKGPETMPASAKTYIRDVAPLDYIIQEISVADNKGQYNEPVLTGVALAPGDSVRLIVRGKLSGNYKGDTLVNRVTGRTENGTPIDITPSPVINPGFKLSGDKQPDRLKAKAGEALNYTITLVNSGNNTMPAGQKVYVKDVPQSEFYVIDNISVTGNTGLYDMKTSMLQTKAPVAPNGKIMLLVKGHISAAYKTGEIGNKVEVRIDSTNYEIPPAPIVNEIKYKMQLAKVANSQKPVGPGFPVDFTITLRHKGKVDIKPSDKVLVVDTLPAGLEVTGYEPSMGTYDPTTHYWTGLNLISGQSARLLVKARIRPDFKGDSLVNKVGGKTPDGTDIDIDTTSGTAVVKIDTSMRMSKLQLRKVASKNQVTSGDSLGFTIILKNLNDTAFVADTITVRDMVPEGYVLGKQEQIVASAGKYDAANGYWSGLRIPAGDSVTIQLNGMVASSFWGKMTNIALGFDQHNLPIPAAGSADNMARATVVVNPPASKYNLLLQKKADKPRVKAGDSLNYTITLFNNGTQNLTDTIVTVKDTLPTGYIVDSYQVGNGNYDPQTGRWANLTLPAGKSVTLMLKGRVSNTFSGKLINTVGGLDPKGIPITNTPANRSEVDVDPVKPVYKLALAKVAKLNQSPIRTGDSLNFEITLYNNNGGNAITPKDTVTVVDQIPGGYDVRSFEASQGSYNSTTGQWTGLNLKSGDSASILVRGALSKNFAGSSITNTVSGKDPNKDPIPAVPGKEQAIVKVDTVKYNLLLTKTANSATATAGGPLDFTITLKNLGPIVIQPADAIVVKDQIPAGYTVNGFVPSAGKYDTTSGRWTGLNVVAGQHVTLLVKGTVAADYKGNNLTNRVTGLTPRKDSIPVENGGGATVTVEDSTKTSYNLLLSKKANSATAKAGGPLDFTITLKNQGPRVIQAGDTVVVKDQIPAGYTVNGFVPSAGKYDTTSGRWTGLNVVAGQHVTLLVKGTVAADYKGNNLTNRVTGLTPRKDSIPVENGGGATVTVEDSTKTSYNLLLSKKANSATAKAGGPLDFTITLKNQGPRVIQAGDTVVVKDQIPAGYTVNGFVPSAGKYDTTSGRWTGLNVVAGQHVTLLVKGTVAADYKGNNLTNRVTGLTPRKDSIPVENGGGATVTVEDSTKTSYNLLLSKKANSATAKAGGPLDFTITLKNQGPRVIQAGDTVVVKDQIPAGYTVNGFVPSAGKYDTTSGRWTGLNVVAGQHVTLLVKGTVAADYKGNNLTNRVTGLTPRKDSIPVENGGGATVTVEDSTKTSYNLLLSKKANSATAKAGGPLDFTITLKNQGPRVIQAGDTVVVKDQIPAGYTVNGFVPSAGKYDTTSGRWTGLNVVAGQHVTLLVKGTVAADYKGNNLTNRVTGLTPRKDSIPVENGGGATVTVEDSTKTSYNLLLSKKANSATAKAGGPLDFTITLKNQGPRVIQAGDTVVVKDQIPAGYTVNGFVPSAGKYDTTSGRWTGLNVVAGQHVTLLVKGTVAADYKGNNLTNRVTGLTPRKDSIPVENGGGATVTVEDSTKTSYNLLLSKKANSATAKAGGPLDFTITLKNQGPKQILPGDVVMVKDQIPEGYIVTSFVPVGETGGNYDATSGRWTGLNLTAGQSASLLVRGTVAPGYKGNNLTNKVTGLTPNRDNIPVENGGSATVEVDQDDLMVPNVITPNGDGVNDVLRIRGLEKYKDPELVIINRWNNLVYKKSNYDNTWNGSGLLEGTYFYVLTVKDDTGKAIVKRGYVMVLR
ncbi:T9SS type B sorting domain-containing protein [Chitinophaga polysaccharea]|uniref:T9SS type B sorting domain-containing protein n=1 Tax=Chitinophaga polysaccharea TaxID=1293035 RepID=UPI00115AEBD6|nr:gliding motility-associated C-terminal domain-containing protein [Chitinophaga polysaccharea]